MTYCQSTKQKLKKEESQISNGSTGLRKKASVVGVPYQDTIQTRKKNGTGDYLVPLNRRTVHIFPSASLMIQLGLAFSAAPAWFSVCSDMPKR